MNNENIIKNEISHIINELILKYNKNNKLHYLLDYIKQADNYIENHSKIIEERSIRREKLQKEKNEFIINFIKDNKIYFINEINMFLTYDEKDYELIDESKIWLTILQSINKKKVLLPWKHKIRIELVAKLKKQTIDKCIPESNTIQNVLNLFMNICCKNKYYAKYLLCFIGDVLQKKQINETFLINSDLIIALNEIEFKINNFLKCNIVNHFKTKYFNHDYKYIRFFEENLNSNKPFLWLHLLNNNIFNIIIVALHYSNRYESAENYIHNYCNCNKTQEHILFLEDNNELNIVNDFINKYIVRNENLTINNKEILYLFTQYLKHNKMPKIMFNNKFLSIFNSKFDVSLNLSTKQEVYFGITSPYLEYVQSFCKFIDSTTIKTKEHYYEVTELLQLYIDWKKTKRATIDEQIIQELIKYFYSDFKVCENLIYDIKCNIWDKDKQFEMFQKEYINIDLNYNNYTTWCKKNNEKYIMSKNYFEEMII